MSEKYLSLPEEFQQFSGFTTNVSFLLLGFAMRRLSFIKQEHLPGMSTLVFGVCLPLLMVGVLWTADIGGKDIFLLGVSAAFHALQVLIAVVSTCRSSPENRGFYMMVQAGAGMAYVYPIILRSPRFGVLAVPQVVMWELGGNVHAANLFCAMVAQLYPVDKGPDEEHLTKSERMDEPSPSLAPQSLGAQSPVPDPDKAHSRSRVNTVESLGQHVANEDHDVQLPRDDPAETGELPTSPSKTKHIAKGSSKIDTAKRIAVAVLRSPPIIGMLIGILLNCIKAPMYELPGKAILSLTSAFGPLLYVLLGASLKFTLDKGSFRLVGKAVLSRWASNMFLILCVRLLPLEELTRGILTLCLMAPLPGTFLLYSIQNGYSMDLISLVKNISDISSFVIMSLLVFFV
eukprot:TRINITY_DN62558_c0_g1_i1.p1 TRINITY_DN62558_c0_g1~~TRINITY_DN62558_c0_g1_i1.p1  ORF type:complete len:415 (+),score=70.94 TRINITY_DN62558_c0_g1_i1:40-1245(+)